MASPILQGALKDGSGEAVVTCDMPEPCKDKSLETDYTDRDIFAWVRLISVSSSGGGGGGGGGGGARNGTAAAAAAGDD